MRLNTITLSVFVNNPFKLKKEPLKVGLFIYCKIFFFLVIFTPDKL